MRRKQRAEALDLVVDAACPQRMPVDRRVDGDNRFVEPEFGDPGKPRGGKVGADLDTAAGAAAAQRCALNLLAQVKAACGGDWARLVRVVKLTGFVNSTPDFTDQPKVVNGASDLLVEVLGEAGRHARSAVSAGALPLGVAVEIEGIFQIK